MLQQVMVAPGKIEFQEVEIPTIGKEDVLIKMAHIGVCGSDIHVYHGEHPFTKYPVTQGHEASGIIVALGEEVQGFEVNQNVTFQPQVVCSKCHPCRHGKYNLCEELKVMGFQTTGAASEFFAVPASKVSYLPKEISLAEGSMIEPLAVGIHAMKRVPEGIQNATVVVLGAGPIGNLVAQAAKAMGAAKVMITDISDFRLEKAAECGIDICINTKRKNLGEAIFEHFGPDKADYIYDCAGNNVTIGQAIKYARKGSTIIEVGVFAGLATIDLATAADHELTITSSMMYTREDYEEAIKLASEGKIKLSPLISKHFPFKEYQQAYDYIDENKETTMKVIIDI